MSVLQWAGTMAGIVVAFATVFFAALTMRDRRSTDYVGRLENENARLEARVKDLEARNSEQQARYSEQLDENLRLMRRLLQLENGGHA